MLRTVTVCILLLAAFPSAIGFADDPASSEKGIRLELQTLKIDRPRFVVSGVAKERLADLAKRFAVYVGEKPDPSLPAILGETRVADDTIIFEPKYPLEPGVPYLAVLRLDDGSQVLSKVFSLEKIVEPPAVVAQVYPTASVLPENQLKFYLHFSRPMSRGEAYRQVALLDSAGNPVRQPFLEIGEELWDPSGMRFTLFFDPGRIKRGLKPREEVGPALIEGESYTLVVRAAWPDEYGQPLAKEFRKSFRVVAPDDTQPRIADWRLIPPAAGSRDPLDVRFPEPLDHAMLHRVLRVSDADGTPVPGQIEVSEKETRWRLTPSEPWRAGDYRLTAETALEDLAGNSLRRPFEVDVARPVETEEVVETATLPFRVQSAN